MRMPRLAVIAFATLSLMPPTGEGATRTCRAESGEHVVPLVELYTSEGCDSCPPADRWLSSRFAVDAPSDAVALAFHVDYWDRLGWKDRFATPAYTARQHQVMRANAATFVYTPQVVLQGRDQRDWRSGATAKAIAAARNQRAGVWIAADAAAEGRDVVVRAEVKRAEASRRNATVGFAFVDSGLVTQVNAGENRGLRLVHDHVVRAFETRKLDASHSTFRVVLRRPDEAGKHPRIVVFVQDATGGDVAQTLALPLADCL